MYAHTDVIYAPVPVEIHQCCVLQMIINDNSGFCYCTTYVSAKSHIVDSECNCKTFSDKVFVFLQYPVLETKLY